jgi:hypothetical protein
MSLYVDVCRCDKVDFAGLLDGVRGVSPNFRSTSLGACLTQNDFVCSREQSRAEIPKQFSLYSGFEYCFGVLVFCGVFNIVRCFAGFVDVTSWISRDYFRVTGYHRTFLRCASVFVDVCRCVAM